MKSIIAYGYVSENREIESICFRCKRPVHNDCIVGIWYPAVPFEPEPYGMSTGYQFYLCSGCEKEIIDNTTGRPPEIWQTWFEEEIKAIQLCGKHSINAEMEASYFPLVIHHIPDAVRRTLYHRNMGRKKTVKT